MVPAGAAAAAEAAARARTSATAIYPHPFLPFYLTGTLEGRAFLWQYGTAVPKAAFGCAAAGAGGGAAVTRVRFNPNGTRFGAVDKAGGLALWHMPMTTSQFSAYATIAPFFRVAAHQKQANDLCFVNSASVVATCGFSPATRRSVCLWDTLLPSHAALVAACAAPVFTKDAVPTRLEFLTRSGEDLRVSTSDLFFVGDTAGRIHMLDLRNMAHVVETVHPHAAAVNSLVFDPSRRFLFSAAADGTTALWSLCRDEPASAASLSSSSSSAAAAAAAAATIVAAGGEEDLPSLEACLLKDVSVFGEAAAAPARRKPKVHLFRARGASKSGITHLRVTQRRRCTCPTCSGTSTARPCTAPLVHPDHSTAIPYTEELVVYGAVGKDGHIVQSVLALR